MVVAMLVVNQGIYVLCIIENEQMQLISTTDAVMVKKSLKLKFLRLGWLSYYQPLFQEA